MNTQEIYFVYRDKKWVSNVPSLPLTKYEVYYHPIHELLGLSQPGQNMVRVYLNSDTRTFIGKTDLWIKIGEL